MNNLISRVKHKINKRIFCETDRLIFNQGQILSKLNYNNKNINSINEVEFKIFSQWGDDGIIDWLVEALSIENKYFVEFGVEDYRESNTRFLMMNRNWSGLVLDGSKKNINNIINSYYYWMYDLTAVNAFIDKDNINRLISNWNSEENIGLLHIDIDGNDYWIWESIECIKPIIVVIEYNAIFGIDRAVTTPYKADFVRSIAHYSNLYAGASLKGLNILAISKGYTFIGCNQAGNNAYFIKNDRINSRIPLPTLESGYNSSKFRESRDIQGNLNYLNTEESFDIIKDFSLYDIEKKCISNL